MWSVTVQTAGDAREHVLSCGACGATFPMQLALTIGPQTRAVMDVHVCVPVQPAGP